MKVRVLGHSEIDFAKWESCVSNSLNACVFAHSWYLDTLTFGWEAIVMDDYEAVMPYFTDGHKACLKFGVAWTGIYSRDVLTVDICRMFLGALDKRFKRIDLVLDKFFVAPDSGLRGLFFSESIHQIDTVRPPEVFRTGDEFLNILKEKFPKDYRDSIRFREYTPQNASAIKCDSFMRLDRLMTIRPALRLKALAENSVARKFGYYMEISLDHSKISGAILVTFCDNYIFVPFIKCHGISEPFGQYVMLLDFLQRHFAYRPGILVLDDSRLSISPEALSLLGGQPFKVLRYKASAAISARKFLRMHFLKRYNNTL